MYVDGWFITGAVIYTCIVHNYEHMHVHAYKFTKISDTGHLHCIALGQAKLCCPEPGSLDWMQLKMLHWLST